MFVEINESNISLMNAAYDVWEALSLMICPECNHELQFHLDPYGCEVERGDRPGYEGDVAQALAPCGCNLERLCENNWRDFARALQALKKAKGQSVTGRAA
jgi:hypothetical protein